MSEHLPECHLMEPCGADTPKHGFCSRQQTFCIHCERECICNRLQACEQRVARAFHQIRAEDRAKAYKAGCDDSSWLAAKQALEAAQHHLCDCEQCEAVTRALAELKSVGKPS